MQRDWLLGCDIFTYMMLDINQDVSKYGQKTCSKMFMYVMVFALSRHAHCNIYIQGKKPKEKDNNPNRTYFEKAMLSNSHFRCVNFTNNKMYMQLKRARRRDVIYI